MTRPPISLRAPIGPEDVERLRAGDQVLLSGIVYTARGAGPSTLEPSKAPPPSWGSGSARQRWSRFPSWAPRRSTGWSSRDSPWWSSTTSPGATCTRKGRRSIEWLVPSISSIVHASRESVFASGNYHYLDLSTPYIEAKRFLGGLRGTN